MFRFAAQVKESLENGIPIDWADVERGLRDAALRDGSAVFCKLLSEIREAAPLCPECGQPMARKDNRGKNIMSLMGEGVIKRGYYECETCHEHSVPKDILLEVEGTSFTPGVRNAVSKLSAAGPFEWCGDTLEELAGTYVSPKQCQRIAEAAGEKIESEFSAVREAILSPGSSKSSFTDMHLPPEKPIPVMYIEYDGTGIPMMQKEVAGRKGKQDDGSAKTREAKLGCIFTQTTTDNEGNPVRDKNSTSYFGAIESAEEFGGRVYANAVLRGATEAGQFVVIGDGAKWIWHLAAEHFRGAIQIVDLYHAKEHIWKIVRKLCLKTEEEIALKEKWSDVLESGDISELVAEIKMCAAANGREDEIARELPYFTDNASRMQYAAFKEKGLFVGSGVIEAGCKTVIGSRLKQSGMFWSVRGANAIIALRCAELSCDGAALYQQKAA